MRKLHARAPWLSRPRGTSPRMGYSSAGSQERGTSADGAQQPPGMPSGAHFPPAVPGGPHHSASVRQRRTSPMVLRRSSTFFSFSSSLMLAGSCSLAANISVSRTVSWAKNVSSCRMYACLHAPLRHTHPLSRSRPLYSHQHTQTLAHATTPHLATHRLLHAHPQACTSCALWNGTPCVSSFLPSSSS